MNKIFSLLLTLLFLVSSADFAHARDGKPKKKHFTHNSNTSRGKNSKAQFRRRTEPPTIDLKPRSPEKFKTARANPNYKYAKGN